MVTFRDGECDDAVRIGEAEFFDDAGDFAELAVGIEEYGKGMVCRSGVAGEGEHKNQQESAAAQEFIVQTPPRPTHIPRRLIRKVGGIDYGAGISPLVEQPLARYAGEGGVLVGKEGRVRPY